MPKEYADELESRAMQYDSEDPGCVNCDGHPASFHVNWLTGLPQPCDYHPDEAMQTLCGCQQFTEKQ